MGGAADMAGGAGSWRARAVSLGKRMAALLADGDVVAASVRRGWCVGEGAIERAADEHHRVRADGGCWPGQLHRNTWMPWLACAAIVAGCP